MVNKGWADLRCCETKWNWDGKQWNWKNEMKWTFEKSNQTQQKGNERQGKEGPEQDWTSLQYNPVHKQLSNRISHKSTNMCWLKPGGGSLGILDNPIAPFIAPIRPFAPASQLNKLYYYHRIHGTRISTYMYLLKNQPFMWVNIPFVPWIRHGLSRSHSHRYPFSLLTALHLFSQSHLGWSRWSPLGGST